MVIFYYKWKKIKKKFLIFYKSVHFILFFKTKFTQCLVITFEVKMSPAKTKSKTCVIFVFYVKILVKC